MAEQAEAPALPHAVPASALGASSRSTAPLVNDEALALAAAPQALVDRSCHTLLCLEMSRAVAASAAFKVRRANEIVAQLRSDDPGAHVPPPLSQADETDMARSRMEAIGLHVGRCLTDRLCRTKSRFQDTLEVFKFVCKELWHTVWDKQIDNLRTNHRVRTPCAPPTTDPNRACSCCRTTCSAPFRRSAPARRRSRTLHWYVHVPRGAMLTRSNSPTRRASCRAHWLCSASRPASRATWPCRSVRALGWGSG